MRFIVVGILGIAGLVSLAVAGFAWNATAGYGAVGAGCLASAWVIVRGRSHARRS